MDQPKTQSGICKLYAALAMGIKEDHAFNLEEIAFFQGIYSKMLFFSDSGADLILQIIKTLEDQNDKAKAEYNRFKAISVSGKVA